MKITQQQLDSMTCKEVRQWVQDHCVARAAGRPKGPPISEAERKRRYRERKKLERV